jgi:pSer/pThr/pTyr-binding forkhead associated (FHA) protein
LAEPELERFLEACDAAGPLQLGLSRLGFAEEEDRDFLQPFVVVGKSEDADLHLAHEEVSRRHAYLQMVAGRLFCIDLESRNGILWEAGSETWGWLDRGRSMGIGPFRIRRLGQEGAAKGEASTSRDEAIPPTSVSFRQPSLPVASLEFRENASGRREWWLDRTVVLMGSSRACKVRLPSRGKPKIHCSLVRTREGVWVVDLMSREGTLVNGAPVRCARLADGDELRLGPYRMRLRVGASLARPQSPTLLSITHADPGRTGKTKVTSPAPRPSRGISEVVTGGMLTPGQAELSDPLLAPLIREFGQMQHQMADQFQQALLTMFHLFSGMHQEQMSLIRDELAQLHRLSEEQRALQGELASGTQSSGQAGQPTLRLVSEELPIRNSPAAPDMAPHAGRDEAAPSASRRAASQPPPSAPRQSPDEIHAQLFERLAAIQNERQGRWQKLLNSVLGKGSGEGLP